MTYQNFQSAILSGMRTKLGDDYKVSIHSIRKNNNVLLDGLSILSDSCNISPTIYLNSYYDAYIAGRSIEEILEQILHIYEQNRPDESIDVSFYTDFRNVSDKILYKLINYKENEALLSKIPHFRFLDLAIVFYCLVSTAPCGSATILIYNKHLTYWSIDKDTLYECAISNTPAKLPSTFLPMTEVLNDLLSQDSFDASLLSEETDSPENMYVLTNTHKLYGASCLLYPSVLSDIGRKLQCDYYILPSSIHEVLLIPAAMDFKEQELTDMVREVNATQLAHEEILSDHVYFYSLAKSSLCL